MQLCCCIIQGVLKPKLAGDWKNIQGRGCSVLALLSALTRAPLLARQRGDSGLHKLVTHIYIYIYKYKCSVFPRAGDLANTLETDLQIT